MSEATDKKRRAEDRDEGATERRSGFKITIPWLGGAKIEATGKDVFLTAIIAGLAVALIMLNDHKDATASDHKLIEDHLRQMETNVAEQTYVLTLDQKKREALNLQMPESLRGKLRRQE